MLEKGWPWDSEAGDLRPYGAQDIANAISSVVTDGVIDTDSDFLVTPLSGGKVRVSSGNAWIKGHFFPFSGYEDVDIPFEPEFVIPTLYKIGILGVRILPSTKGFEFFYSIPTSFGWGELADGEVGIAGIKYSRKTATVTEDQIYRRVDAARVKLGATMVYEGMVPPNDGCSLGTSSQQWATVYANNGVFSNSLTVGGKSLIDLIYPVGSIYMSTNNVSPSSFLGGTWVAYAQGQFILGAGGGYAAGSTGGESTVTLKESEMPAHKHNLQQGWGTPDGSKPNTLAYARNPNYEWASSFVQSAGGGQPHNNMPPYIVCYVWRRTA